MNLLITQLTYEFKSLFYRLAFLVALCLPNFALCQTDPMVYLMPKEEGAKPIEVPRSIAEMSVTIKNLLEDFDKVDANLSEQRIPVNFDSHIVKALVASLIQIKEKKESKIPLCLSTLKTIISSSISSSKDKAPEADDYLNYFFATNTLDIPLLIKAALAIWVDRLIAYEPNERKPSMDWDTAGAIVKHYITENIIPKEFHSFVYDYLYWIEHHNFAKIVQKLPNEIISPMVVFAGKIYRPKGYNIAVVDASTYEEVKQIKIGSFIKAMTLDKEKLYATTHQNHIFVIDLKNESVEDHNLSEPIFRIAIADDVLYVVFERKIRLINIKDWSTIGYISTPYPASGLLVVGTKLYLSSFPRPQYGEILVIDLKSMKIVETINLETGVHAMAADKNHIYAGLLNSLVLINTDDNSVINIRKNVVVENVLIHKNNLYFPGQDSIVILELKTNKLFKKFIPLRYSENLKLDMFIDNDKLYLAQDQPGYGHVIDLNKLPIFQYFNDEFCE